MAKQLTDAAIHELSIVLARDPETGVEFAPRNPEARVLSVKGGAKVPFLSRVTESLKGYFAAQPAVAPQGFPVTENVEDDIDHDGDGAEDYNCIVSAVCCLYSDLSQAMCINDDGARSIAVKCAIDSFLEGLDAARKGDDADKAGARHSAADKAALDNIAAAHREMENHMAAISGALQNLGITAAEGSVEAKEGDKQDGGPDNSQVDDDTEKAEAKEGKYGDVAYADEKNKKYPIDTEEHARAAWSYINQEKNAAEYSSDELATIKDKIRAACKKFGIEISDEKAAPIEEKAAEVEMKPEDVQAMIAEALKAQQTDTDAKIEAAKAEAQAQIEEAKKAAAAQAELAERYKAQAEQNAQVLAAVAGNARGTSALSAAVSAQKSGASSLQSKMLEQMKINPEPTRF